MFLLIDVLFNLIKTNIKLDNLKGKRENKRTKEMEKKLNFNFIKFQVNIKKKHVILFLFFFDCTMSCVSLRNKKS